MTGALDGLKVLDFSRFLPGPYCTWLLADMGAEVIRVEHPRELAKQAKVFGWDRLSAAERERQRRMDILARNKKSILMDIGDPEAQAQLRALAAQVDVVVEDYRPGVLAKLGLGHDDLMRENPALVTCSLTLCGQTGPYRDKPGHDPIALSIAGVMSRVGEDPEAPQFSGIPAADVTTGTHAAFGILAALRARDRDGKGQHVDIAMSDCAMSLITNVLSRYPDPEKLPPRGARRPDAGLWKCADGTWLCTTDMEPRFWRTFCETVGHPEFADLQHDVSARERIRETLAATFATQTRAEWIDILEAAGTQYAPVHEVHEALQDPHVQARGMAPRLDDGHGGTLQQVGPPVRLSRTPAEIRHLAHMPGEDTEFVLSEYGLKGQAGMRET